MIDDSIFRALVQRVRRGDEDAAAQLVRLYEPEIRRAVRVRLVDPKWCRAVDSMDVCQSVLGKFFVEIANGRLDMESPDQLLRWLIRATQNRVADAMAAENSSCSDEQLIQDVAFDVQPTPSKMVAAGDLMQEVQRRLSDSERAIFEQRIDGRTYAQIAKRIGGTAEDVRRRLRSAIARIRSQLDLDESQLP